MSAPTHISNFYVKIKGSDVSDKLQDRLVRLEVDSALGMPSMFMGEFMDEDLQFVDDETLFKVGNEVEIGAGENVAPDDGNSGAKPLFKGEITSIEPRFVADGKTRFVVRGYDKSHRLHRIRGIRTFLNVTDSDVLSKIVGENSLQIQQTPTRVTHDHVFQPNQTDFEVLTELSRRNGMTWFVDTTGKLIIDTPTRLAGKRGEVQLDFGSTLLSFEPRLSIVGQRKEVEARGWDVKAKQAIVGSATSSDFGYPMAGGNGVAEAGSFGATPKMVVHEARVWDTSEAETIAKSLLTRADSGYVQGEGVATGNPAILAGAALALNNIGTRFNSKYFVTGAQHTFDKEAGYKTRFRVTGLDSDSLGALLGEGANNPGAMVSPRPFYGMAIGIVTNDRDNDAPQVNKIDQVKVKFPWMSDTEESTWARIAQPLAGNDRGWHLVPNVNDEVLVAFEHGDFNRPYIVGSLWNGSDKPPAEAVADPFEPENVYMLKTTQKAWFVIDDRSANDFLELKSKGGHHIKIDNKNKKIEIATAGGHQVIIDEQGQKITMETGQQKVEMATGGITLTGSTIKLQSQGTVDIQASGAVTVKGATIALN